MDAPVSVGAPPLARGEAEAKGILKAKIPTATHWGSYSAEVMNGQLEALHPVAWDPEPTPMGRSFATDVRQCRIAQPMIRRGFLERGSQAGGEGRGGEPFVAVDWDFALDLAAAELSRVRSRYGPEAIFAGSYGWASAGRFHHAPYHLHRFMNLCGGFVNSVNAYSYAAAEVILPHVVQDFFELQRECTTWTEIADHTELLVMLGGMPAKNAQVGHGGVSSHKRTAGLTECINAQVRFVNISPVADDADAFVGAEWFPIRPNSDIVLMLALAHTLLVEKLHDTDFLARCTVGFDRFERYLLGESDGALKSAEWAARLCGIDAARIRSLAREMAAKRTLITVAWALQRADHGEQPYWMAVTLAAMLGQIGLPGAGFGFGYSSVNEIGSPAPWSRWVKLDVGTNPVSVSIPVARIADMLLHPGREIDYNGHKISLPHVRLIYWAGGNPFHHHQDLNRLLLGWQRPETIIVNEPWWTATARHADIVFPATTTLERNDVAYNPREGVGLAMHQVIPPVGQARNDYDIFSGLAARLDIQSRYTETRTETEWLRHLYERTRVEASEMGIEMPSFDLFWNDARFEFPRRKPVVPFANFRRDPQTHPLTTPSGRIEIFSTTIDSFGYTDCPGHPVWLEPEEWLGSPKSARFPLHLISNQPKTRLHSQLDHGSYSRSTKIAGHEPLRIHPQAAAARGVSNGDIVRVFNERGECLAGAVLEPGVHPEVVQLSTGAWYDPHQAGIVGSIDRHGNPNMLTLDKGTSRLAQGPISHTALVEVERYDGHDLEVRAFYPPPVLEHL